MEYIGSYVAATTVPFSFNTRDTDGAPITFAGTPLLQVLNATTLAVVEDDLAPTVDVNTVTGRHLIVIDTNQAAYTGVTECIIAVKAGTVDAISVVGEQLARFSLTDGTLPAGSITSATLADGTLTAAKIADNAISATKIATGALTAAKFASGAFDAVWTVAVRLLTAGTNIVLAKGTGVTGLNDLSAVGVRAAVGLAAADLDTQLDAIAVGDGLDAAGVRAAIGMASANLDTQLAAIAADDSLDAAGVRAAIGLTSANLDTQLAGLDTLIDGVQTTASAVETDTQNIQSRIPDALDVDGNIKSAVNRFGSVKIGVGGAAPSSPIGEIA